MAVRNRLMTVVVEPMAARAFSPDVYKRQLPELANTLYSLASSIPGFVNEIKDFLQNVSDNPLLTKQNLMKIDLDWNKICLLYTSRCV